MMPQHSVKGCELMRPAASRLLTFRWGRSTGCCQAFYGNHWGWSRGVYDNKSLVSRDRNDGTHYLRAIPPQKLSVPRVLMVT